MFMGDVKRFRKEVVDSIGTGTASPVRAVFSSTIADGDTFLMGEMAGVDEGLVIQELSRADELVKLQHELEKQVGKLAELGELKWLEQLETLQTEEIQKVKDSIGEMEQEKIEEVQKARKAVESTLGLKDISKLLEEAKVEALKKWDKVMNILGPKAKEENWEKAFEKLEKRLREKPKTIEVKWVKVKEAKEALEKLRVEELTTAEEVRELAEEVKKVKGEVESTLGELEDINKLLEEGLKEKVEEAIKEEVKRLGFNQLGLKKVGLEGAEKLWSTKPEKVKEAWEKVKAKLESSSAAEAKKLVKEIKVERLTAEEVKELEKLKEEVQALRSNLEENWKNLKQKLDELEIIKELKEGVGKKEIKEKIEALGKMTVEELNKFRESEEIAQLKALAEVSLGKLEARKIAEVKTLEKPTVELLRTKLGKQAGRLDALWKLEAKLKEELAAIRELKELGLEERLRELAEVREVKALAERQKAGELDVQGGLQLTEKIRALSVGLGRLEARRLGEEGGLEEVWILERLGRLDELVPGDRAKTLGGMKVTLKQLKEMTEQQIKEKSLVERSVGMLGWLVGFGERVVTGKEALGDILKGKKLVDLEKRLAKIKALEELTEIAEKRGVATVMKAALTSAMEITKNRGWTDYLKRVDSDKKSDAVKELIAAEKIRKLTQYINTLEVCQQYRELQLCRLVLLLHHYS